MVYEFTNIATLENRKTINMFAGFIGPINNIKTTNKFEIPNNRRNIIDALLPYLDLGWIKLKITHEKA